MGLLKMMYELFTNKYFKHQSEYFDKKLFFLKIVFKTGFRCSLPMKIGVKMSDFEASKKRNAPTGKVKKLSPRSNLLNL